MSRLPAVAKALRRGTTATDKQRVARDKLTRGDQSVAVVDGIATVDAAGKRWVLALVNRHPTDAVACTTKLGDKPLNGMFPATVLAGDSPDAFNDIENPGRVTPQKTEIRIADGVAQLPPHSLMIVRCE